MGLSNKADLKEQYDQGLHCLPFHLHPLAALPYFFGYKAEFSLPKQSQRSRFIL